VSATSGEPNENPSEQRPLLVSIQPRFADAILDGRKTVELRRTRVAAPEGSLLVLYATAPTMAVVGLATLHNRDTDLPNTIWRRYRHHMALRRDEFDAYLAGAHHATALTLRAPQRLAPIYSLAALRNEAPFNPPQSYRYIAPADPHSLRQLVAPSTAAASVRGAR
jgi:predicted transcriptional regulator